MEGSGLSLSNRLSKPEAEALAAPISGRALPPICQLKPAARSPKEVRIMVHQMVWRGRRYVWADVSLLVVMATFVTYNGLARKEIFHKVNYLFIIQCIKIWLIMAGKGNFWPGASHSMPDASAPASAAGRRDGR